MSIPMGFWQGNRSEYLAIPALCKLGFTVPVPRQEDHFGVDFIVHLARMVDQTVTPSGRSFGIQIKANEDPLIFNEQHKRDCLYDSSLPFFLGVVSRTNLTLTVYNTLNRLNLFWMLGRRRDFTITCSGDGAGLPKPDFDNAVAETGEPILVINMGEAPTAGDRLQEIQGLQATMRSWIDIENQNLSLKEQDIPLVFCPETYNSNEPLTSDLTHCPYRAYASSSSLRNICRATQKPLTALSFYLDYLQRENGTPGEMIQLMRTTRDEVESLKGKCNQLCEASDRLTS